ncbi:MAG: TrmH family RNA methyltransferase, partial [Anaerolineae bacterium]
NWLTAAGVVARASAGASELVPMAVAETAVAAAGFFRERGLVVACTAVTNSQSIYEADLTKPLFLLIGGEKRGITRSFLEQADVRLQIPYGRPFNRSLGAAASAAIVGFEVMRQRRLVND